MENISINTMADVRCFFYYLIVEMELGAGFHPDTPIEDYTNEDGSFTFENGVVDLQCQLDRCYQVCLSFNEDIYEVGLALGRKLGYYPAIEPETREEESNGGQYSGVGFTFDLDISEYLEREGIEKMPSDMWDEIEDDVASRAHEMMNEGYHSGELCVTYNDDVFYGWWYSK